MDNDWTDGPTCSACDHPFDMTAMLELQADKLHGTVNGLVCADCGATTQYACLVVWQRHEEQEDPVSS